jgi:hypothetical protein
VDESRLRSSRKRICWSMPVKAFQGRRDEEEKIERHPQHGQIFTSVISSLTLLWSSIFAVFTCLLHSVSKDGLEPQDVVDMAHFSWRNLKKCKDRGRGACLVFSGERAEIHLARMFHPALGVVVLSPPTTPSPFRSWPIGALSEGSGFCVGCEMGTGVLHCMQSACASLHSQDIQPGALYCPEPFEIDRNQPRKRPFLATSQQCIERLKTENISSIFSTRSFYRFILRFDSRRRTLCHEKSATRVYQKRNNISPSS